MLLRIETLRLFLKQTIPRLASFDFTRDALIRPSLRGWCKTVNALDRRFDTLRTRLYELGKGNLHKSDEPLREGFNAQRIYRRLFSSCSAMPFKSTATRRIICVFTNCAM